MAFLVSTGESSVFMELVDRLNIVEVMKAYRLPTVKQVDVNLDPNWSPLPSGWHAGGKSPGRSYSGHGLG